MVLGPGGGLEFGVWAWGVGFILLCFGLMWTTITFAVAASMPTNDFYT